MIRSISEAMSLPFPRDWCYIRQQKNSISRPLHDHRLPCSESSLRRLGKLHRGLLRLSSLWASLSAPRFIVVSLVYKKRSFSQTSSVLDVNRLSLFHPVSNILPQEPSLPHPPNHRLGLSDPIASQWLILNRNHPGLKSAFTRPRLQTKRSCLGVPLQLCRRLRCHLRCC